VLIKSDEFCSANKTVVEEVSFGYVCDMNKSQHIGGGVQLCIYPRIRGYLFSVAF